MITGYFKAKDGRRLYHELMPIALSNAILIYVHGFAEHCGRYMDPVNYFAAHNYTQVIFDYRGHGRADGKRGFIQSYDEYLEDVDALIKQVFTKITINVQKVFLIGHSQGGLISFLYALKYPDNINGLILSAPAFRFAVKINPVKKALSGIMSSIAPYLKFNSGIDPKFLSKDIAAVESYMNDPLIFHSATPKWYVESLKAQEIARKMACELTVPVLFLCAGQDKLVSSQAIHEIFNLTGSKNKTLKNFEFYYHELFNEIGNEEVFKYMEAWLEQFL